METNSGAARYHLLHDLIIVLGYLVIMWTLDLVYSSLLLHAWIQKRVAAHRERAAARRRQEQVAASAIPATAALLLDTDMAMDTDMQQAA